VHIVGAVVIHGHEVLDHALGLLASVVVRTLADAACDCGRRGVGRWRRSVDAEQAPEPSLLLTVRRLLSSLHFVRANGYGSRSHH
jgi:hypothetical protein